MNLSKEEIGDLGEKVVQHFFEYHDHEVKISTDRYDQEKDMLVDGKDIEVKTQTIYRLFPCEDGTKKPAFTVPITYKNGNAFTNQLNKCLTVERLIFVARPNSYDPLVRIYEAPRLGKRTFQITVNKKDNRIVAGFLLSEMKELGHCFNTKIVENLMDNWKYQ